MDKYGSDDSELDSSSCSGQLSSPIEENHPLSPRWIFWLKIANRNKVWSECLEQQCILGSIEDFVALKLHIVPPSGLPLGEIGYFLFKEGIKPMWEDPNNQGGGSIDIIFGRQFQYTRLDKFWFDLLMSVLGGQFGEYNNKICGLNVGLRFRGYTISLWINDTSNVNAYFPIVGIIESKLSIFNDASVNISVNKHPVTDVVPANSMTSI